MLCCWERIDPILGCFCRVDGLVAWAVASPLVSLRPPRMQMLCCCEGVGPIRGCFAVLMVFVLRRMLPPVFRPPLMQMLCCCERVGPFRGCFVVSMVFVFGRMLCHLEFLVDALPLLSPMTSLHCWLPLGSILMY
jgi:hypothetical protein